MMPILPIVVIATGLVIFYVGANVLLSIATAVIGFSIAVVVGAVGYKMVSNTKGGCDLFDFRKCK